MRSLDITAADLTIADDVEPNVSRLVTITINGTPHHLHAIKVETTGGMQVVAEGEAYRQLYEDASSDAQSALQTTTIPGLAGDFVFILTPYGD